MNGQVADAFALLPNYLAQHVILSAAALALGLGLSLPLALLAARQPSVRWPLLAAASLIQTIPGLALLALFYPVLLGVSALLHNAFGIEIRALGFLPSLLALTLYSMLPILRNGIAGLTGLEPSVLEAADGVGMTARQKLFQVEIPLAAPVVMAGVRTAAVWTIGAATLSTPVGQTSLGNYIFSGLQTENWIFVLFGCAAAAMLALIVDQVLGVIETGAAKRDRRRMIGGFAVLVAGAGLAGASLIHAPELSYVIGAKNFSEQFILAQMMQDRLNQAGAQAQRKEGLGSAIAFRALSRGELDVYVDYSGTLWTNVLARTDSPPRDVMLAELTREMKARFGVEVLGRLGFENAYALAMKADDAKRLGIVSIADLSAHAPNLRLGADIEFLSRPEWSALKSAYALTFKSQRSYNPTFMYRALESGEVDVISAFSSDGRVADQKLTVLADPRHAIPAYDALILISPKRIGDGLLHRALRPILDRIPVERMREANLSVDRDQNKQSPAQAGAALAAAIGLTQ